MSASDGQNVFLLLVRVSASKILGLVKFMGNFLGVPNPAAGLDPLNELFDAKLAASRCDTESETQSIANTTRHRIAHPFPAPSDVRGIQALVQK